MISFSVAQIIQTGRVFQFIFLVLIGAFIILAYYLSKRGKVWEIRPLEALDGINEHIGRAAEMGTPVLVSCGQGILNAETIAGLSVIGEIAAKSAKMGVKTYAVTMRPQVVVVAESIMRQALTSAGKTDWYLPGKYVKWFGFDWLSFSSGTSALILEHKPALCVYIGTHTNESIQIFETGARTGCVQVGGLGSQAYSVPVAMFADYLAIGTEQYALSAALTKEPMAISTLAGEDWAKVCMIILMVFGLLLNMANINLFYTIMGW